MRHRRRGVGTVSVVIAGLLAATTIALAEGDESDEVSRHVAGSQAPAIPAKPTVQAVPPGHKALGVLRRARTSDDVLPARS
jgi:hypothetical protein